MEIIDTKILETEQDLDLYVQTTFEPETGEPINFRLSIQFSIERKGDELHWDYWFDNVWGEAFSEHPGLSVEDQNKIMALFKTGITLSGWTKVPPDDAPLVPSLRGSGGDPNNVTEYFLQD